jgi:hypothetical protein
MDRNLMISGAFAFLALTPASAALTLVISDASESSLGFTIAGDFSGLVAPSSLAQRLFVVPVDSFGDPISTWTSGFQTSAVPAGEIDGNKTIQGWAVSDSFFPSGDSYAIEFSTIMTTASVITTPVTVSTSGLVLDMTAVERFDLYWGSDRLAASSPVPEPSTTLVGAMSLLVALRRRPSRAVS